jgi:hypothetical protein
MSRQGMVDADDGTLTGRAPAARIFALVILSLTVLLGSLLAVSAIGSKHDSPSAVSARPAASGGGADGVLVVPKDEPKPKPKPKPQAKAERKEPVRTSAASSSSPAPATSSSSAPATSSAPAASSPAPVVTQSAPAPAPTPAPAPAPAPAPKASSASKKAPVQHTVVVTE